MDLKKLHETDENVVILPGAKVCGDVQFGSGCSVWYNAVIRADGARLVVGKNTNIQEHVMIHADAGPFHPLEKLTIGDNVTIGHGAIVHCDAIGDRTLIGMGSILLQGARIGSDCVIAAGALVTGKMDIPDGSMVMGSPAKIVRAVTQAEREDNMLAATSYAKEAQEYRNG